MQVAYNWSLVRFGIYCMEISVLADIVRYKVW